MLENLKDDVDFSTVDSSNANNNIEISQCNSNTENLNAMDSSGDMLGDVDEEKDFHITSTCVSSTLNKLNESNIGQNKADSTIKDDDIVEQANQNEDHVNANDEVHSTIENNIGKHYTGYFINSITFLN